MTSNEVNASRRLVLGGLSTSVAAAAFSGTANAQSAAPAQAAQPLQDPTTKYPQPPFPRQSQEWPGLTSRMDPRPDHGEESYQGSGRLTGRKALITGGDSGIGRAAAIAYAREGADVAIGYLEAEEPDAQEVIKLIEAEGRKAVALPGDIRDESFCQKLVADAVEQLGGLDILVNNAARQQSVGSLADLSTEQLDNTLKTNIYAMFWITKAALPHLQPGSTIINTTSVVAYSPPKNLLDYSATKAAIENFTKGLAKQVASKGIRVNGVAPGPFWTPLQPSGGQPTDALVEFGSDTPMGRPGQPAELAGIYVLLASPETSYSTGQIFGATGGNGGP
ncbi:SDR family oxidoreductase [Rhizobium rosettiformans]|uniref:SDR family oxidoreductase n=1 Tax=Rhizobium rosettiformans TaxID=1368430 RepID=UPI0028615FB9|nr:SDR family oxidoreductase [Rhizobium rosettiformans]MDR7029749.1 NAD(P)-dependent dehydrogenase (short-subunit alcohol dehydrogenase family) [Rhizobium rosettiformans]MDR7063463.1 NAD(P)-dependent dehydrogenase (short-subunit alcohol dehydrogenase family) [Rhizobium rosettiformans]